MTLAGAVAGFDAFAMQAVHGLRAPWLTALTRIVTELGSWWFVSILVIGLAAHAGIRRGITSGVFVGLPVAGAGLLSMLSKMAFGRLRPPLQSALIDLPASKSLPSGHAMASFVAAAVAIHLIRRSSFSEGAKAGLTSLAVVYAVAVAFSRVYLGVHWASDVIASWVMSAAWITLLVVASSRLRKMRAVAEGTELRGDEAVDSSR